jgi:hypothetical protein
MGPLHTAYAQPVEKTKEKPPDGTSEPDEPDASGELYGDSIGANPGNGPENGAERRTKPRATRKKGAINASGNGAAAPDLGLPPLPVPPYEPGTWDGALIDEIRRLHEEDPKRSAAWLGKRTGQPKSVVEAVLQKEPP